MAGVKSPIPLRHKHMLSARLQQLTRSFHKEEPADPAVIERLKQAVAIPLPDDYLAFLQASNGAMPPESALQQIFSADDVLGYRESNDYGLVTAGLTMFATDGGGTAFCFYRHGDRTVIVGADMEDPHDPETWAYYGQTLEGFLDSMAAWDAADEEGTDPPPRSSLPPLP
jgi:hypothetical protein